MTSETALSAEALDVVVKWLVAGLMQATVNTPAETEAYQHVVSGRAERAIDAALSQPASEGLREALTKIANWQTHGPLKDRDADAMVALARAALAATEPPGDERT